MCVHGCDIRSSIVLRIKTLPNMILSVNVLGYNINGTFSVIWGAAYVHFDNRRLFSDDQGQTISKFKPDTNVKELVNQKVLIK